MSSNKDKVIEYFAACNRHDADAIADAYSADGVHIVTGGLPISGVYTREQMRAVSTSIMEAFPSGLAFDLKSIAEEGDTVFCEIESKGVHAAGSQYHQYYAWVFKFVDGKVGSSKEYFDTEHFREVMLGGEVSVGS